MIHLMSGKGKKNNQIILVSEGGAAVVIDACDETNKLPCERIKEQGGDNEIYFYITPNQFPFFRLFLLFHNLQPLLPLYCRWSIGASNKCKLTWLRIIISSNIY